MFKNGSRGFITFPAHNQVVFRSLYLVSRRPLFCVGVLSRKSRFADNCYPVKELLGTSNIV